MINLTFNDETQIKILEFLGTTEKLISDVTSMLSRSNKKAEIYAMSDLGLSYDAVRMMGGFFTGTCTTWECDVPFVPIDVTMNVCGVCAYRLNDSITPEKFKCMVEDTFKNDATYKWNYNRGNHFCTLCYCDGKDNLKEGYYIVVHASAAEYKEGNMEEGLFPEKGNWYYDNIKTYTDSETGRYLRYLDGKYAEKFWNISHFLEKFNEERNRYFIEKTFKDYIDEEVINIPHYGMPTEHSICIGCQWKEGMYTLLTAPGEDIYFVNPLKNSKNTFVHDGVKFTLSPHGLGLKVPNKNDNIIISKDNIIIGGRSFKDGQGLNIDVDAKIRGTVEGDKKISETVEDILKIYPGEIQGKMKQIASITKRGFKEYGELK